MRWYDEWRVNFEALKDEGIYPPDRFLDWDEFGLEVVVRLGRRSKSGSGSGSGSGAGAGSRTGTRAGGDEAKVEVDMTWDPEITEGCGDGCREYSLVQEYGTGRMVVGAVPVAPRWV